MESGSRCVLLLLGIAVVAMALAPPQKAVSYEEAISLAVDLYNRESETGFAFRLLEARPQPEWDPRSQLNQKVQFTMKETTCPTSGKLNLEQCDFRDEGHVRVRRNAVGRFFKKIKNGLSRAGRHSLIAHAGHRGNVQRV
ncbi:hypothetical protein lerEdw1_006003 [Lerista edwardsae]|nr:hypothetical protein lerEdw1_006003 [Lerista edwardsae]